MRVLKAGSGEIGSLRIMLEIGVIVVSVLLALAANEWRAARGDRALVDAVLATVRAEMTANRAELERAREYREQQVKALEDGAAGLSLRPAFLRNTAWETAQAMGAARLLDFEVASALAEIHQLQLDYRLIWRAAVEMLYFGVVFGSGMFEARQQAVRGFIPILHDMQYHESELLARYDALARLVER